MSSSTDEMLIPPHAQRGIHSESEIEENKDRLSDLHDSILLHILSFLKAKDAVQTCILSTRWKDLWKHLQNLILHSDDFSRFPSFNKFVSRILTRRNGSISLHGLDIKLLGRVQPHLLKRILKYSSHTLTSLKLSSIYYRTQFPTSLNLPALTTLHLNFYTFCANDDGVVEPFSVFTRLNSLIIENCTLSGDAKILCISGKTLTNLTLMGNYYFDCKLHLSSPILRTFSFRGDHCLTLSGRDISSIEHVNFDIDMEYLTRHSFILLTWPVDLANIKSMTVSTSTLQVLFMLDLLKLKVPILGSLKSLKIIQRAEAPIPDGIVDFLLQNSPSAKVDIIKCSCNQYFYGEMLIITMVFSSFV